MTDTPHCDIAFRAGCPWYTCDAPNCQPECENYRISALEILRAALPWDLPAERLEAMCVARYQVPIEQSHDGRTTNYWAGASITVKQNERLGMLEAYRADPIMRELYPEKF